MFTVRVRRIGKSLGVVLPPEVVRAMNLSEGDRLCLTETTGGIKITPYDPHFAAQLRSAEKCIRKYRNALRELGN